VVTDVRKEVRFTGTGLHMHKNPVLSYPALRASKTSFAQNELKNKERLGVKGDEIIVMGGF